MEATAAIRTLELLADGRDPATGLSLPDASPFNQPLVVRSLFTAIRALESAPRQSDGHSLGISGVLGGAGESGHKSAAAYAAQPANAGKPWTPEEDSTLCTAFDQGLSIKALAAKHGRSTTALNARLFKLGKIADPGIPLRHPVKAAADLVGRKPAQTRKPPQAAGMAAT